MKLMNAALFVSSGALVTSLFHQLSAGKIGNGPGGAAPSTGTVGGHCANAVVAATTLKRRATTKHFVSIADVHDVYANVIVRHDARDAKRSPSACAAVDDKLCRDAEVARIS
jgi:hypothetical protein